MSVEAACNTIKEDIAKIESNVLPRVEADSFNLPDFWNQFEDAVQSLSSKITMVSFVCGKTPFPKESEVEVMVREVMQCYVPLRDLYQLLPEEVGAGVFKSTTSALQDIMKTLLPILASLRDLSVKGAQDRLTLTGTFWDACNNVESVAKNNLQAAMKALGFDTSLASDALEELTNALSEYGSSPCNPDGWTEEEQQIAVNAVGLVKVTHLCLQRLQKAISTCGSCSTPQQIAELDQVVQAASSVSPALDDFVLELYHPVNFPIVNEHAGRLVAVLRNLLSIAKEAHFKEGLGEDVINNLLHFISHNYHKVDPTAPTIAGLTNLKLS